MPKSADFFNLYFWDKVICRNSHFTFQTFIKQNESNRKAMNRNLENKYQILLLKPTREINKDNK